MNIELKINVIENQNPQMDEVIMSEGQGAILSSKQLGLEAQNKTLRNLRLAKLSGDRVAILKARERF